MASKNRKKIGVSDHIPKSTKNDLNIVLKKVQNPKEKRSNVKIPIKRNCPPAPRTPFKTVNIKRNLVNDVIMTVESTPNKTLNKRQLPIRRGSKMKSEAAVVARALVKNELVRPIISTRSIKDSIDVFDKPKSYTSVGKPQPVIEAVESKSSEHEFKELQGNKSYVIIGASSDSLHSVSSRSSSVYAYSAREDIRTDISDSFYDCFETKSSPTLKLAPRKYKQRLWKRDMSLCKLLHKEPDPIEDDTSEEINPNIPVHNTYSSHMLSNFKKLLHQHSPNNSKTPEDGRLSGDDIDVLKKLVEADERYCYLKHEDHHLLKEVLMEQLKQIELQERVFEATLKKLKQSISSCDFYDTVSTPDKEDVRKSDIVPENNNETPAVASLSINIDLMEALTSEIDEMHRGSISDISVQTSRSSSSGSQKTITKERFLSHSARNPELSKLVKKDTFIRPAEVLYKNSPSYRKEAKILNVISARSEKPSCEGQTPKRCLEDLGVFLNYVSTKIAERVAELDEDIKTKLTSAIRIEMTRKTYKIGLEYYAFLQHHITRKATIFYISECLLPVKEFLVQYLCMDDRKSPETFYVCQRRNGYNAGLEETDPLKLQPEFLARILRNDKQKHCPDISIFEYERALAETRLKGRKGWRPHGDAEYSMKQLMYCLFKTWARYPTLYDPHLQPGDIAQLVDNKSKPQLSRTSSKNSAGPVNPVVKATNATIDKDLKTAEFGSKMKTYLVPTVQITLFAIFVLSFVGFEYRCV